MRLLPRFLSGLAATAAAAALLPIASQAADHGAASYPHQPITMIMGFNAGSGVDVMMNSPSEVDPAQLKELGL